MTTSLPVHQMMAGFLFGTSESLPMEVRSVMEKITDLGRIWAKQGREKLCLSGTIKIGSVGEG